MANWYDKATVILAGCATVLVAMALWAGPGLAESRAEVRRIITEEARDNTVPASLALAVAKVESDFGDDYESPTGARGVMQIMPRTAVEEYGVPARHHDPDLLLSRILLACLAPNIPNRSLRRVVLAH